MTKYKLVYTETNNPDEEQKIIRITADDEKELRDSIEIYFPEAKFYSVYDEKGNIVLTEK